MNPTARRLFVLAVLASAACQDSDPRPADAHAGLVAYTGATLWDGTEAPPIRNATMVVRNGRIERVDADPPPAGATVVDLSGRYVVPGLVDAHAHVTGRWAPDSVSDPAGRLLADLRLFARYGVTTVNSLGGEPGAAASVRSDQDRPGPGRARLFFAGEVVTGDVPAEAEEQVAANVTRGVDWIKMRVDDNLGTAPKMPWPAVAAAIEAAHRRGVPVATHLFYLDDARRLLDLGTDLIAHSVRDRDIPADLAERLGQEGICTVPTLTREVSTFVYGQPPDFLDDPFFTRWAMPAEVAAVTAPDFQARMAASPSASRYREALAQAQRNLKILLDAGAPIAFGTDAGPAGRFPGYFEHMELVLMVEAGLTPTQALQAATSGAADCLGLADVGVLEAGRWADFLVLRGDPLQDVMATRTLETVYVGGTPIG